MINRFYKSAPVEFQFEETPLKPLMMSLEARQKRYDDAYLMGDELRNKQIQALQKDQAVANELAQGWQNKIDEIVDNAQGDYSSAYKELRSLKNQVNKDFLSGGKAHAIQTNYANFMDSDKRQKERLAKGDITLDQYANWKEYELGNYQGVTEKDPILDSYTQLQPEEIASYVDTYKLGLEAVKELEPFAQNISYDEAKGGWIFTRDGKVEMLDPKRIQQAVYNRLSNDPKVLNFYDQYFKHRGQGPEASEMAIISQAQSFTPFAYMKTSDKQSREANPWDMLQAREAGANARLAARLAQNDRLFGQEHNIQTRTGLAEESGVVGKPITLQTVLESGKADYQRPSQNFPYGMAERLSEDSSNTSNSKERLLTMIKNGSWKLSGGNQPLIEKILKDNPDISAQDALNIHNEAIESWQVRTPSELVLNSDQTKELNYQLLKSGDIKRGTLRVKAKGSGSFEEMAWDDVATAHKDKLFKDGDPDKGFKEGIGITSVDRLTGEFNVNIDGLQIKVGGGSYANQMSPAKTLAMALSDPDSETSPIIQIPGLIDDQSTVTVMRPDPNGSGELIPVQEPVNYSNKHIRARREVFKDGNGKYQLKLVLEQKDPNTPSYYNWQPMKFGGRDADINDIIMALEQDPNNGLVPNFGRFKTSTSGVTRSVLGNSEILED